MREQQFIRFVQEICYLLKLSQPCSKTALQYFLQFKEYENHHYDQEILIAASIYLSVKIFQEEVRIRDILNMIYVLTSLYKVSSQQKAADEEARKEEIGRQVGDVGEGEKMQAEGQDGKGEKGQENKGRQQKVVEQQPKNQPIQVSQQQEWQEEPYISLKNIQKLQNLHELIQPHYSLSDYNDYKGKIIEAEQMLLRILGFSFSLSQQNKKQLKRLLITFHHMRIPPTMAETVMKIYNDIHYINIKYWPEGVIYFSFLLMRTFIKQKESEDTLMKAAQSLQIRESKSQASHQKANEKENAEINRIKQFVALMGQHSKWEELFCTDIKQLEKYAEKLTIFYSGIRIHS